MRPLRLIFSLVLLFLAVFLFFEIPDYFTALEKDIFSLIPLIMSIFVMINPLF